MKILKISGIVLVSVLFILSLIVYFQPTHGQIEESIVINVSPNKVYKEVNGFKTMKKWEPWAKLDPSAYYQYEGLSKGVGAKVNWNGPVIGKGSQWIVETIKNQKVRTQLSFEDYEGKAYAEFVLIPQGDATKVTWKYECKNEGFKNKAMWMIMKGQMKTMYSQGLNDLKIYIEELPNPS